MRLLFSFIPSLNREFSWLFTWFYLNHCTFQQQRTAQPTAIAKAMGAITGVLVVRGEGITYSTGMLLFHSCLLLKNGTLFYDQGSAMTKASVTATSQPRSDGVVPGNNHDKPGTMTLRSDNPGPMTAGEEPMADGEPRQRPRNGYNGPGTYWPESNRRRTARWTCQAQ